MTPVGTLSRAAAIARRFAIKGKPQIGYDWATLADETARRIVGECAAGKILLIAGASGSGKSLLMRHLAGHLGDRGICADKMAFSNEMVIDCLPFVELEDALAVLARFGLGEVYTYLSPASLLSTGQQSRLRLAMGYAKAMSQGGVMLVDEFATQLDRFSAAVIARNLRRALANQDRVSAVVATCHDDLATALRPDVVIECDFGEYRTRRSHADAPGR